MFLAFALFYVYLLLALPYYSLARHYVPRSSILLFLVRRSFLARSSLSLSLFSLTYRSLFVLSLLLVIFPLLIVHRSFHSLFSSLYRSYLSRSTFTLLLSFIAHFIRSSRSFISLLTILLPSLVPYYWY